MKQLNRTGRKGARYALLLVFVLSLIFVYSAQAQALLQVGSQPPDFSLRDVHGSEVGLSSFSQKKVVLVFWSTWSANSQKALRRFEEFHKKYADRGIQIVGINADNQTISPEDLEKVKRMVTDLGITFPVLLDRNLNTFRSYEIIALPSTVVISDGRITYELPGYPLVGTEQMFDYLLTLVGETPKTKVMPKYQPRYDAVADANLARSFVKKDMNMMAYPLFKQAIEKDPKYIFPYVALGKLYRSDGNNAQAEEILRKALSMEPGNVVVMSELGYLLCKTGKLEEALAILGKAAAMDSYTPSHYYLGYALGKDGKLKEALAAFDTALSLNPFDYKIYLLRAETYENSGMLKKASADYRKALELLLKIKS
jgi:Tfp pilus assembly protein PilF/peroxiredoxin